MFYISSYGTSDFVVDSCIRKLKVNYNFFFKSELSLEYNFGIRILWWEILCKILAIEKYKEGIILEKEMRWIWILSFSLLHP